MKLGWHQWEIFVDTGGTFTDCLAVDGQGREKRVKVLSSSALRGRIVKCKDSRRLTVETAWSGPDRFVNGFVFRLLDGTDNRRQVISYLSEAHLLELDRPLDRPVAAETPFELLSPEEAPLLAARLITDTPADSPLPPIAMRLATTRGTNALLTKTGTPPVLFVTTGFTDLLEIGNQARPDLFALEVKKPRPVYARVVAVPGRLDAAGQEILPLDADVVAQAAQELAEQGHRTAAVALLHADKNPAHEQRVADCLDQAGFTHISCSADLVPFIKIGLRAETAVVDAYLSPVIKSYLQQIRATLSQGSLFVMTSTGGLVSAGSFRAKDSLLSGPAGGIAGAAAAGWASGIARLIAFDMGGTSTDVARYDGDFEYIFDHAVGDVHLSATALAIESVAAGGGSICSFDGIRLKVGPESASADPGPACYGAGGPLTITDVNLLLGRVDHSRFEIPIVETAAQHALNTICEALAAATGEKADPEALLEGFLELANQRMADAIRRISLRLGYDPAEYAVVAFGGAGPQHALAVAERLGAERVLIPPHPGLLSTQGLRCAVVERFAEKQILAPLSEIGNQVPALLAHLGDRASQLLTAEGVEPGDIEQRRRIASLRFMGQDATLEVNVPEGGDLEAAFRERYQKVFGHLPTGRTIELVSLRAVASTRPIAVTRAHTKTQPYTPAPARTARVRFAGAWQQVLVYDREELVPGAEFNGPCLVLERYSIAVIEPGWQVTMDHTGALIAVNTGASDSHQPGSKPDAVLQELYTHRFETIAREMGEALRRTAISTNVKERLDFSCALLDPKGELIVNAPHIPVHLGSMGICVREITRYMPLGPGDTVVTNHPSFGGSHLPDVTLVSAVHSEDRTLLGYVASRAHHAEIGGTLPGSMPPAATRLAQEGVVMPPTYLVKGGTARWEEIREILLGGPFPTRTVADNLADLAAALAANTSGGTALRALAADKGKETVGYYMERLKNRAEQSIRAALARIPDGRSETTEVLDDGARLQVALEVNGDRAKLAFASDGRVHPGNLNATPAIVNSAVLYVLRLLIDEPLPLNEGLMCAVDLEIQPGLLNPAFPDDPAEAPAVVGGNVETSQRLVNALLRVLGLAASSQGTMNNVLFGDASVSYYETVCGGCGAGPGFAGASAVHSHMTNTRITDPEIIEHRYPVRVERFAIRKGSGGEGRYQGGDGAIRELSFLAPLSLSILSQHRTQGPLGLAGGGPGKPGAQRIYRADGTEHVLGAIDTCSVGPGDRLVLETPGGGGYGKKASPQK
ncbi:MAG: hydantoinase B/oxoprolinase family protein [Myxococcota bacterium]|nr:hydantoinase B/oxoprolinase family protein [Myxococcota bacterium]